MVKCIVCGSSFEAKRKDAKHCSIKCRVAASRNVTDNVSVPVTDKPSKAVTDNLVTDNNSKPVTDNLTPTDRLWEDHYPNYHIFSEELFSRVCVVCQKPFETHLSLLKVCSPKCREGLMDALTGDRAGFERAQK